MATIKDVAKLAGVAISTVSCALNGDLKVKPSTKQKVLDAARQLNYQKNGFAMDLKRSNTKTIALILWDLSGPFFSELVKGVQDITASYGYDLIACSSLGDVDSTAVRFLKEKRADGVIILAQNLKDELIVQSAREGFPIVMLDRKLEGNFLVSISVDNERGGFLATEYLIKKGHKKIAFVSGSPHATVNILRFNGYKEALRAHGLDEFIKSNIVGKFTKEGGYNAAKMLIMQGELPTAIFFANDEMAIGAMKAFEEYGILVPDHISIVGFDDIELAAVVTPPLTSIKQPKYEIGTLAANLLFQMLSGQKLNKHYNLNVELVERKSCKDIQEQHKEI